MITRILDFLFDLVLCEVDAILIIELLNRFYGKISKQYMKIYLAATIFTLAITFCFHYAGNYNTIFCNMLIYFALIGFYPADFKKKLLISVTLVSLNISALLILNDVTNILPKGWIILGLLGYHIIFWCILYLSMQFSNNSDAEIPLLLWSILYIIPIFCSVGTCFSVMLIKYHNNSLKMAALYHLPVQLAFLVINLMVFILYSEFVKFNLKSKENALLVQQIEYQKKHFRELEESASKIKEMRHEMKNYIKTALFLYERNSPEKLINYLEDSMTQLKDIEEVIHTGNLEIDALLNIKLTELDKCNIRYQEDVLIPSDFTLPFNEMVIILGNLFDNALEACTLLPEEKRYVEFTMHFIQGSLFINMKNTFGGEFSIESKKKDKTFHGLGIKNIEKIVKEYNGILSYEANGEWCVVDIILYSLFV